MLGPSAEPRKAPIVIAALDFSAIATVMGLLIYLQSNLNRYWDGLTDCQAVSPRLGVGEIIFLIVGAFIWIDTLSNLLSESYRTVF